MILTVFTALLIAINAKAQYLIVTNSNDSINCIITDLDDDVFHYKTIDKPKHEGKINKRDIKKMVAIDFDTIYNTFNTINESERLNRMISDTVKVEEVDKNLTDSSAGEYLIRAGNNQIAAKVIYIIGGIAGTLLAYNGNINGLYVTTGGILVGTILDFVAASLVIKAGEKLKEDLPEKSKKLP